MGDNELMYLQGWPTVGDKIPTGGSLKFIIKGMTNPSSTTKMFINIKTWNAQGGNFLIDSGPTLFPL